MHIVKNSIFFVSLKNTLSFLSNYLTLHLKSFSIMNLAKKKALIQFFLYFAGTICIYIFFYCINLHLCTTNFNVILTSAAKLQFILVLLTSIAQFYRAYKYCTILSRLLAFQNYIALTSFAQLYRVHLLCKIKSRLLALQNYILLTRP